MINVMAMPRTYDKGGVCVCLCVCVCVYSYDLEETNWKSL